VEHVQLQQSDAPTGGDFTLQSPDGPVSLADQRGKVVLLYFGYTFCPDVCPTSLSTVAQALSALTPDELAKVKSYFISVDPERDTMDVLKAYAPFFHPGIVGISGSSEQVARVAQLYGAVYMKQKPDANGLYSVDHSSFIYVIAPNGKLAATLPHGTLPTQIVDMIRSQLTR
jgi:protein SCO1